MTVVPPPEPRPASETDLPMVAALQAASFPEPWSVPAIGAQASLPGAILLLAEHAEGVALGYVLGQVVADEAELRSIAVSSSRRRSGIGRLLLDAFEARAAAAGAVRVFLEVAVEPEAARCFYIAAGYREIGRRPGYYRRGRRIPVDAVVMARDLDGDAAVDAPGGVK